MKLLFWLAPVLFGVSSPQVRSYPAAPRITVIVNKSNPVNDLTMSQLAELYLGRVNTFGDDVRVARCEHRPARARFYQSVLRMSESAVSRHWIGVVFSARNAKPPKEFQEVDSAQQFVAANRGGICFVESLAVTNAGVKAILVGGRAPNDASYPLR